MSFSARIDPKRPGEGRYEQLPELHLPDRRLYGLVGLCSTTRMIIF